MTRSRFTEEQIAFALKQWEPGTPVAEVCRRMGIIDATLYLYPPRPFANVAVSDRRVLRRSHLGGVSSEAFEQASFLRRRSSHG